MTQLPNRITTDYVELHDRLRIAGELPQDGVVIIWLTQRLVRRLIPYLLQWLDQQVQGLDQQAGSQPRRDVVHGFAQEAARMGMEEHPRVDIARQHPEWLASRIDYTTESDHLVLTLRNDDGHAFGMRLAPVELRQWLTVLHGLWAHAEWPMDIWPDWLDNQTQAERAPPQLH
jgi:hypothetical protein